MPESAPRPPREVPSALDVLFPEWMRDPFNQLYEQGRNVVLGLIGGTQEDTVQQQLKDAAADIANTVVNETERTGQGGSPWRRMQEQGEFVVQGLNEGITDNASLTGPVVRMWLRSEVIAQARSILLVGEGRNGGLAGVASDAVDAFTAVFSAGVSADLANALDAFGRTVVTDIMTPIKDPRTGLSAQMRSVLDNLPRAPAPPPPPRQVQPPVDYNATGGDYMVGGYGGTDSRLVSFYATPGELVHVRPPDNTGQRAPVGHTFNITVNGGDPDEVRQAVAAGIRDGLGDEDAVPSQMLDAWRTAKGQGFARPTGVQTRGARG